MTKMIVADDELLIRQGLETISWTDYGIELAGTAANGIEALELVKSVMPAILLTDIRMPGMDGLKLIDAARKIVPDIKSILLTGYQDFDYAHTAIKLGAIEYILKPSDPCEIVDAVLKAKKQIDEERRQRQEREMAQRQLSSMQHILLNALIVDNLSSAAATGRNDGEAFDISRDMTDWAEAGTSEPGLSLDCCTDVAGHAVCKVKNPVIRKVLDYIESNYMEDLTLVNVSRHVFMNHIYLGRLIKKETGETFLEILTRIRLRKACEMLGDLSLKTYEVAEKVGIRDSAYFSQVFKKYFGLTPSEYREKVIYPR